MMHAASPHRLRTSRLTARLAFVGAGALLLSCADFGDPFVPSVATVAVRTTNQVEAVIGDDVVLAADVRDAAGRPIDGAQVTWLASDLGVVQVQPQGATGALVSARAAGTATVVATCRGVESTPIEITVRVALIQSITITSPPNAVTIPITRSVQFTARVVDERGNVVTGARVVWSASAPAVAIDSTGFATGSVEGAADVTATLGTVHSAPVHVVVRLLATSSVTITSPASPATIPVTQSVQFAATVVDEFGNFVDNATIVWNSSNAAVAIDTHGLATGSAEGTADVTATSGNVQSVPVQVVVRPLATGSVEITSPASPVSLLTNQTVQFAATVRNELGAVMVNAPVAWNASSAAVSIGPNGLLRAIAGGPATVTATNGGVQSAPVTVNVTAISFATAVQPIFDSFCVRCHGFNGNLTLSDNAYDRIVNEISGQNPSLFLVKPGDPDNSYIYLKMSGCSARGCAGDRMPPGSTVGPAALQTMRDWILGGAAR